MIEKVVLGDLVQMIRNSHLGVAPFMVMAHGCNCFCTQGSGIAGQLREFPEVFKADFDYGRCGEPSKLGHFSRAIIQDKFSAMDRAVVYNLYTQFKFGGPGFHADYDAIKQAFSRLNELYRTSEWPFNNNVLYIPKIGAGLANGDWPTIEAKINVATPNLPIVLVEYQQGIDPRL